MLALETVVKIRVDHSQDEVPIRAIARKRRVSWNAVREDPEALGLAASAR